MENQIHLSCFDEAPTTPTQLANLGPLGSPKTVIDRVRPFFRVFGTAWQDAKFVSSCIQEHSTRKICIHVMLFLLISLTLASSGLVVIPSKTSDQQYCDPGGNFDFTRTYDPWAAEHTFQITLGFGRLSFTQAKAINVLWDVVVGRGGQFLLTAICFHVFSKSLNLRLEQTGASISYNGFRAIVFEKPSLSSTLKLVLELRSAAGWRTKASILWMVGASLYVVAFPTITSAMSGYSSNVDPYFDDGTGNGKIPIPDNGYFHRAIYLITGADRIEGWSLSPTYLVGSRGFTYASQNPDLDYWKCLAWAEYVTPEDPGDCSLAHALTQYISSYGADSSQTTNISLTVSSNRSFSVLSPGLTIETFNTFAQLPSIYYDSTQYYLTQVNQTTPFLYTNTNGTRPFDVVYINNEGGTCDSQLTYLWGFSFIQLFGFLVITGVWALGMYIMWIDALRYSRLDCAGRTMGFYRGIADMSNAIWKDSLREPSELASDSKVRELLAHKLNGGKITFDELDRAKLPPARTHTLRHFKQNVHSLNGWTKTWSLLHWTWFLFFAILGLAWSYHPLMLHTRTTSSIRSAAIVGFLVTGACWLIALVMLSATMPGLTRLYNCIPYADALPRPRPLACCIWIALFTIAGGISCFVATAFAEWAWPMRWVHIYHSIDHVKNLIQSLKAILRFYVIMAMLFWTIAAMMFLVGLFSTLWRWSTQVVRLVSRQWQRPNAVPLAQEVTSFRSLSVSDNEPDWNVFITDSSFKTPVERKIRVQ